MRLVEEYERRHDKRRASDKGFGGLLIVTIIISIIAGMFIGMAISDRVHRAEIQAARLTK